MSVNLVQDSIAAVLARQSTPVSSGVTPASGSVSATPSIVPQAYSTAIAQTPSALQNVASLQDASGSFAQFASVLQVAQTGTQQISSVLQQLQSLASTANASDPSGTALETLNGQFQDMLSQIDNSVSSNSFAGTSLLSGASAASGQSGIDSLLGTISLPDLSVEGLFGNNPPAIATPQDAASALLALNNAQGTVSSASAILSGAQNEVGFASAGVETALANSVASSSVLTESDISGDGSNLLAGLYSNPAVATQAQTGNLSGSLLSLLQE